MSSSSNWKKRAIHVIENSKRINGKVFLEQPLILTNCAHPRLKQEIHDLRQKLELQSSEYDENHNGIRRRFQDSVSELTSQVEALSKGKSR
jgi:hypothetical protein